MHSTTVEDPNIPGGRAGVDFYFLDDDGNNFKATVEYDPYFLIAVKGGREQEVEEWCRRILEGVVKDVHRVVREDLQMPNHLLGNRRTFLRLSFANVGNLLEARKLLMPIAEKNKKNVTAMDTYAEMARYETTPNVQWRNVTDNRRTSAGFDLFDDELDESRPNAALNASDFIIDIREYDVPYHVRVSIDKGPFPLHFSHNAHFG